MDIFFRVEFYELWVGHAIEGKRRDRSVELPVITVLRTYSKTR